jgi:hypothetical protein
MFWEYPLKCVKTLQSFKRDLELLFVFDESFDIITPSGTLCGKP